MPSTPWKLEGSQRPEIQLSERRSPGGGHREAALKQILPNEVISPAKNAKARRRQNLVQLEHAETVGGMLQFPTSECVM